MRLRGPAIINEFVPSGPFFKRDRDPKTNSLLWGITEHAQWAILQGNRERNFDQALAKLVADLERLVTPR